MTAMSDGDGLTPVLMADAFERIIRDTLESAAMQGLCRDGQIEAAVGVVRALHPDLSPEQALGIVRRIASTSGRGRGLAS